MNVIMKDIPPEYWILGVRAAKSFIRHERYFSAFKYETIPGEFITYKTRTGNIIVKWKEDV